MILHHIADCTSLFVKFPSARDTKILSHRDLHTFDVIPIPDRLEKRVRETEVEYILHRFLAKIMINPKDSWLRKNRVQYLVQSLGRGQVPSKGLLEDHASIFSAA